MGSSRVIAAAAAITTVWRTKSIKAGLAMWWRNLASMKESFLSLGHIVWQPVLRALLSRMVPMANASDFRGLQIVGA
jgi:hypothetical protein